MEIIIEGKEIFSPDDFYKQLSKQVPELGEYFGNNLDALWDYIDIFDGKTIIWKDFFMSEKNIGSYVYKIINIYEARNEELKKRNIGKINVMLL